MGTENLSFNRNNNNKNLQRRLDIGFVKTMGGFCYVKCDDRNCDNKIEQHDVDALKNLAKICGWERRGQRRLCPECVNKEPPKKKRSSKSK